MMSDAYFSRAVQGKCGLLHRSWRDCHSPRIGNLAAVRHEMPEFEFPVQEVALAICKWCARRLIPTLRRAAALSFLETLRRQASPAARTPLDTPCFAAMSGNAIQAVKQFTKTGVGSRTSIVKEITIGISLGLAAGLTWKVGMVQATLTAQ